MARLSLSQKSNDLALWETFLSTFPPGSVLVLGAWWGGTATFLGLQGVARESLAMTHGRDLGQAERSALLERPGAKAHPADVCAEEGHDLDLGICGDSAMSGFDSFATDTSPTNALARREWEIHRPFLTAGAIVATEPIAMNHIGDYQEPIASARIETGRIRNYTRFKIATQ